MSRNLLVTDGGLDRALADAAPGDIIELAPGRYAGNHVLRGKGDLGGLPITIRAGAAGPIDCGRAPDAAWRRPPGGYDHDNPAPADDSPPKPGDDDFAFLKLINCRNIVVEGLALAGCWPSIFYLKKAQRIVIRGCDLAGGTYAIFAKDPATELILVENNRWRQDTSPGHDLWSRIDWAEAHGGEKGGGSARYFNGGFVSSKNIAGAVVIRGNSIEDAYNGIRMKADFAARTRSDGRFLNSDVHVYDNDFIRIRDNPVELEDFAQDWHVRHNRLVDCHAWFSMDGCRGGFWYFYGNTARFTSRQGLAPDQGGRADARHTMGRVLKLSYHARVGADEHSGTPEFPWYVFNNSFFLRCPIIGGFDQAQPEPDEGPDFTANLAFFNNAFEWAPAPSPDGWTCIAVEPIRHFDLAASPSIVVDFSLWAGSGWPAYPGPALSAAGHEAKGLPSPSPLFPALGFGGPAGDPVTAFALAPGSAGLGSGALQPLKAPGGAQHLPRRDDTGRLNRGAVQAYGLVSVEALETRPETLFPRDSALIA